MNKNNVVGIIYANVHDDFIPALTKKRSMASVPFGSRYRLVDFHLSNLVNAGISKVGIITNNNYHSLMDHIGSGSYWDLDRRRGGIKILPPYNNSAAGVYTSHVEALSGAMTFLRRCSEEYVVLCDSDVVVNLDLKKAMAQHIATGADITYVCTRGDLPVNNDDVAILQMDETLRVTGMKFADKAQDVYYSLDITIMRRELLMEIVKEACEKGYTRISKEKIIPSLKDMKIYGFLTQGFVRVIDGMQSYIDANMDLLNSDVRRQFFSNKLPIYTKTRDDMPTRYGINSSVSNSLIASGCVIKGTVKNSIIFRGVTVEEGSVVEDCILMQDTSVGSNCNLKYVLADKRVEIGEGVTVSGEENAYKFLEKETSI